MNLEDKCVFIEYFLLFVCISVYYYSHLLIAGLLLRNVLVLETILTNSTVVEICSRWHLHSRSLINSLLQFGVCLLLNSLGILKFLDQFHFEHFHLHNFSLFLPYHLLFFSNLSCNFFSCTFMLLSSVFFNLCFLNSFLLFLELGF